MPKKGYINWSNCEPRALLLADLQHGILPISEDEVTAEEAWEFMYKDSPEFRGVCFDQFKEKLADHRKQVKVDNEKIELAKAAYLQFQQLHPRQSHNHLGLPIFNNHAAKALLKEDIKNKRHKQMTPRELWKSRPEYMEFDPKVFRGHIYQEKRLIRWFNYLEKKKVDKKIRDKKSWAKQRQQRMKQEEEDSKKASFNSCRMDTT